MREWIGEDPKLSIQDQCCLTGVSRSGFYYEPGPETAENLELMRLLDEQYLHTPFWGSAQHDLVAESARLVRESETSPTFAEDHGPGGDLREASIVGSDARPSDLPKLDAHSLLTNR